MLAAIMKALDRIEVEEIAVPEVDANSALLKVEAVSLCGSDLRILKSGNPRVKPPAIIGHEAAGQVVKAGKNVKRVREGQRVAIGADVPCGVCSVCRSGHGNNCDVNYAVGYQISGAFCQYMLLTKLLLEEGPVTPIPDHLSYEEAALAEPLGCAVNGLEKVAMSLGKSIAIIGMGPIGCMMVDLARAMGASKVLCAQRSAGRMAIARQYGADAYIDTSAEDLVRRCREETDGAGPDVVITSCASVEAHEQAIDMVAHMGYVNLFGGLPKDTRPMQVLSNTIHYKECYVTGSHGATPRHHELAVGLLANRTVRVAPLMTHRFPLERIQEAFVALQGRDGMKIMIRPWGD